MEDNWCLNSSIFLYLDGRLRVGRSGIEIELGGGSVGGEVEGKMKNGVREDGVL